MTEQQALDTQKYPYWWNRHIWFVCTEPPIEGSTQETIVCFVTHNRVKFAVMVEYRRYRQDASFSHEMFDHSTDYVFDTEELAVAAAEELKAQYEHLEYEG